ncbi:MULTISPECIES: hypothetical protein [Microcoleaceae]|uniref:hypothetical protein n=1 Tax=Microcoleaceae TaxID=1892252 RepID=UPI001880AF5D|nr:hypothetical protein [Tychonema sp. LEGE 06208]MBE9165384.1 hypothetical protein [Tychonema sp. LEGE 06208]
MDTYPFCTKVLFEAASLARRVDGEVIVFYVINIVEKEAVEQLGDRTQKLLSDIRHQLISINASVSKEIIRVAQD